MENIERAIEAYVGNTKNIITALERGDYDNFQYLADKREKTLDLIKSLSFTKEELQQAYDRFEVDKYCKILNDLAEMKKAELRKNIESFKKVSSANKSYLKQSYIQADYFNRTI